METRDINKFKVEMELSTTLDEGMIRQIIEKKLLPDTNTLKIKKIRMMMRGGVQVDHYHDILKERKDNPCTPEEQKGNR